jgi:hypothetical protein
VARGHVGVAIEAEVECDARRPRRVRRRAVGQRAGCPVPRRSAAAGRGRAGDGEKGNGERGRERDEGIRGGAAAAAGGGGGVGPWMSASPARTGTASAALGAARASGASLPARWLPSANHIAHGRSAIWANCEALIAIILRSQRCKTQGKTGPGHAIRTAGPVERTSRGACGRSRSPGLSRGGRARR